MRDLQFRMKILNAFKLKPRILFGIAMKILNFKFIILAFA